MATKTDNQSFLVFHKSALVSHMAGGKRLPSLDYDLLYLSLAHLGTRPKDALANERLITAHSFARFVALSNPPPSLISPLRHLRLNHGYTAFI